MSRQEKPSIRLTQQMPSKTRVVLKLSKRPPCTVVWISGHLPPIGRLAC
ncbi:GMP synthase PP-ATPase subunit [Comamonas sp. BIGb0152]|nr:GMP synthase PP-ATPase subunit [Comamonas sp. BIGb0152]